MIKLAPSISHDETIAAVKDYYVKCGIGLNPEEEFPLIEHVLNEQFQDMVEKMTETPSVPMKYVGMFDYRLMTHHTPEPESEALLDYHSFLVVYLDPEADIDKDEKIAYSLTQFGFFRDRRKVAHQLSKPFYHSIDDSVRNEVNKYTPMNSAMTRTEWLGYTNGIYHHHHFQKYGGFLLSTLAQGT